MRYSGPAKRRREAAPGRIPPLWATRPTPGGPLWPPRYPALGSPYFVPFLGGGPPEAPGAGLGPSAQAAKKDKAKIVQFEWNGCTFYRYIPEGTKGAGAAPVGRHVPVPGEPPIPPPLPPFGRPRFEWHQRTSRSQSRRRKHQQVFPPRASAPPWTPGPLPHERPGVGPGSSKQFSVASAAAAAAAAAMGATGGGAGPYRPREPNLRIPRKENKTPASHLHLPPFLATASSKTATKTPSPTTATHVQGPPRAAAFRNKDSAAPLPFSLRAAFGVDDCCTSPALPKKNDTPGMISGMNQSSGGGGKSKAAGGGNMTARRSHDGGVPESDMLGAKPKKPPRMNNMTFRKSSSERSNANSSYNSGNKSFGRAPPFRNSPRVYSSTVLKDFNAASKQDNARGTATDSKPMLSVPREIPPKEQRSSRQDRRVRYKAEIVGTNIIVTQEEPSPDKKSDTALTASAVTGPKTPPQTAGVTEDNKVEQGLSTSKVRIDIPKAEPAGWKDRDESAFQSHILHAALLHGTSVASEGQSSATADAFTQLTTFEVNEQFDRFLSPGPICVKQEDRAASRANIAVPSRIKWSGKFRSVPVQTDETKASIGEPKEKHVKEHGDEIIELKRQEKVEKPETKDDLKDRKEAKPAENIEESPSEGEEIISPASYADGTRTSSSEIYLDSLVSNGTSTSSPHEGPFRKPVGDTTLNPETAATLLNELDEFLTECSPIRGARQPAEKPGVARSCECSTPISEGASGNSCAESAGPDTSSSLSKGDGFSDISEPPSPLAKDLQAVPDSASLASDMILINFAEDTTTLKEHLDGLVADYKSKQEGDVHDGTGMAFSPEGDGCRSRDASSNGMNNGLEKQPGLSPPRSNAPALLPSDVPPLGAPKMASEEARTAGGDFRSSSVAKEPLHTQKDRVGEAFSDRGDSSFKTTRKPPAKGTIQIGRQRSIASCDSCGAIYCGSINSKNFPRVCSCKTKHGARAKGSRPLIPVQMEEALKEEYRDPEIVSCFVEENVQYLLESEDEEYEQVKRRGHQTSHHERSDSCSQERSVTASQRYPENSTSWNKIKDASEASVIAVAGTERCGSEATTGGASRALIYDCPWWTYDNGDNGGTNKGASSSTALGSGGQVSANTSVAAAVAEIASNAAATLHPWSTTLRAAAAAAETGVQGATTSAAGALVEVSGAEATAAAGSDPWGPFLATAQAIVGPKREAVMSSGDHETGDEVSCRVARSDADFTTLYMEGQPRKPSLKQRWPASAEAAAAPGPGQQHGGDRDSLSFYEFPLSDQHEALPPQQHSLSMETLVGSNRLDVASTTSTVGCTERRLAEGEPMPPPAEAMECKTAGGGAPSPDAQYCELELYAPVNKSGPTVCAVVVPPHSMAEGDCAKGEGLLLDSGPQAATPPDDAGLCGDKKVAAETNAKPMGKIRTRFRDFFWKHK